MGRSFLVSGYGKGSGAVAADTRERLDRMEAARELELRALLESDIPIPGAGGETYRQRAERVGLDRMSLENARRFLEGPFRGRTPATAQEGVGAQAAMEVRGERYLGTESWVDGHGDTHTSGYTKNGPLVKQVTVVETRATPHTRLVTRTTQARRR